MTWYLLPLFLIYIKTKNACLCRSNKSGCMDSNLGSEFPENTSSALSQPVASIIRGLPFIFTSNNLHLTCHFRATCSNTFLSMTQNPSVITRHQVPFLCVFCDQVMYLAWIDTVCRSFSASFMSFFPHMLMPYITASSNTWKPKNRISSLIWPNKGMVTSELTSFS